jgi:hypothetical protein
MAAALNDYFSSVFTDKVDGPVPAADEMDTNSKLDDIKATEKEVMQKIKDLKPASAPGPDRIGSLLLKELADQVVKPLTKIYNSSLTSGEVPEDWKRANVTPIYKKGTKSCKLPPSIINIYLLQNAGRNCQG